MLGGLFDYADYYSIDGQELAESKTELGRKFYVETQKKSIHPSDLKTGYQKPLGNQKFLSIVLPIYLEHENPNSELMGVMELGRSIPDWRNEQVTRIALTVSVISAVSALLCGMIIYPRIKNLIHLVRDKNQQITESHLNLIDAMGRAVAKKESSTGAHNYRVTYMAIRLGEALKLSHSEIQHLIAGAFLHDVGKIAISDAILLKPGKLTQSEWDIMRAHVEHGEEIVKGIGWLDAQSLSVISGHHERWDGTGYPRKISGRSIPLLARIFAVADVFDAISSKRSYKEALGLAQVMEYLDAESGKHFDPEVVAVCKTIASDLYAEITGLGEEDAKVLLTPLLNKYFEIQLFERS